MFAFINNWLKRRIIQRSPVTDAEWDTVFNALPILHGLNVEEKSRLRELAILFLNEKVFEGAHNLHITQHMKLCIALQACLPVLNLGLESYQGWVSVIVYPAGFSTKHKVMDEYGVVHQDTDHLTGEAWQRGPVILAWTDVEYAGVIDGHNLVVHEFAHKLDMQNGIANGFPPLRHGMKVDDWVKAFSEGFEHFQHACETGHAKGFDCYAATSPAEFFAVFSEVFFEKPGLIRKHYPAIFEQLVLYYQQDPAVRLKS